MKQIIKTTIRPLMQSFGVDIVRQADRDMMPDPSFYASCLQTAFDELKAATIEKAAPKKKKAKKKKTAAKKAKPKSTGNGAVQPGADLPGLRREGQAARQAAAQEAR